MEHYLSWFEQIEDPNTESLPHRFFFYGTLRDDAVGTTYANNWTESFASGSKGFNARIYGFKLYKHKDKDKHFPFAIQTYNQNDYIIGRVMEFEDKLFNKKLKHANYINGYNPKEAEKGFYSLIIVDAYLDQHPENENGQNKVTCIKAISYFQKLGHTNLKHSIAIPNNDWMQPFKDKNKNILNVENDNQDHQYPTPKLGAMSENKEDDEDSKLSNIQLMETNDDLNTKEMMEINVDFEKYFYKNFGFGNTEITDRYFSKFKENEVTNLEMLMVCDDKEFLDKDIGMKSIHKILFLKKLNKLKKDHNKFEQWLNTLNMTEYLNIFTNKGLLTFELFYQYVGDCDTLIMIIGPQNKKDAQLMWTKTPKYLRQNEAQLEGQ